MSESKIQFDSIINFEKEELAYILKEAHDRYQKAKAKYRTETGKTLKPDSEVVKSFETVAHKVKSLVAELDSMNGAYSWYSTGLSNLERYCDRLNLRLDVLESGALPPGE